MLATTETYLLTVVVAALIIYAKMYERKNRNKQMKINFANLKGIERNSLLWETFCFA
jgi:hypothetical protein